jgi:hypothetical protein
MPLGGTPAAVIGEAIAGLRPGVTPWGCTGAETARPIAAPLPFGTMFVGLLPATPPCTGAVVMTGAAVAPPP